jgi:hypothetical protein
MLRRIAKPIEWNLKWSVVSATIDRGLAIDRVPLTPKNKVFSKRNRGIRHIPEMASPITFPSKASRWNPQQPTYLPASCHNG